MLPHTHYAKSGSVSVAYQVLGAGPLNLVYIPGWISNLEILWEEPACARFLKRLASFSRLIIFDKQGTGLSDRVAEIPGLEVRMDDVRAVLERLARHARSDGQGPGRGIRTFVPGSRASRVEGHSGRVAAIRSRALRRGDTEEGRR